MLLNLLEFTVLPNLDVLTVDTDNLIIDIALVINNIQDVTQFDQTKSEPLMIPQLTLTQNVLHSHMATKGKNETDKL